MTLLVVTVYYSNAAAKAEHRSSWPNINLLSGFRAVSFEGEGASIALGGQA